jgi:hypothetical protein
VMIMCWNGELVEDQMICPPIPTTTFLETTTTLYLPQTTFLTTTTVPVVDIACMSDSDCEKTTPFVPFCDGNIIKAADVKYTCMRSGTPQSRCTSLVQPPKIIEVCPEKHYCHGGQCYPEHCRNKVRDFDKGEEKIDCGGPCRPCNQTDVLCRINSDCGIDSCGTPYCNAQQNPTNNCTRNICTYPGTPQSQCTIENTVEVLQQCSRNQYCREGDPYCRSDGAKANCYDCIQNQGEERIDCGGPCRPCAPIPLIYDTLNLTATETIQYQTYKLKLDRLIREINCSTGARITITDLYGVSKAHTIDRYTNTQYFDIELGFLNADTNSALIWIRKHTPE